CPCGAKHTLTAHPGEMRAGVRPTHPERVRNVGDPALWDVRAHMTHAIHAGPFPERALPPRVLPDVPPWAVSRPRVAEQLELGVSGLMPLVTAPTAWGKTLAVAEWATDAQLPGALIWVNVAGVAADPDVFWLLL